MSLTLAVTGATGVLGRALLRRLRADGHRVRALARERKGRALPELEGVRWIAGGLEDETALDQLVEGTDAILHTAYCDMNETPPGGSSQAEHFIATNIMGTARLVARSPATRLRQMIFVSSLAVYGEQPWQEAAARGVALDEDFPVWPREFYGGHKAALEKLVIAASGRADLNTCVFRLGCLLGEYPRPERDPLAPVLEEALGGSIRTAKGAHVITDEDAAALLAEALGDGSVRGQVYNTFHRWLDFADLAAPLQDLLGREVKVSAPRTPEPTPPIRNDRLAARAPGFRTEARIEALLRRLAGG